MKALVAAMEPIQFYSCFISYNHTDKSFARRVHDTLQGRVIRCWLDEKQMIPGDDIYEAGGSRDQALGQGVALLLAAFAQKLVGGR